MTFEEARKTLVKKGLVDPKLDALYLPRCTIREDGGWVIAVVGKRPRGYIISNNVVLEIPFRWKMRDGY